MDTPAEWMLAEQTSIPVSYRTQRREIFIKECHIVIQNDRHTVEHRLSESMQTRCLHNKCADIKVHVGFTKIFVYSSCLNITVQINVENMSQW